MAKKSVLSEYQKKENIVKRLNERIASIVRKVGAETEEVERWTSKLTRSNSPYISREASYKSSNAKLARNKGVEAASYTALSRRREDIEKMSLKDLERLEEQTKGYGAIKKEAKEEIRRQRAMEAERSRGAGDYNQNKAHPAKMRAVSDEDIANYLKQKEKVRQFLESNTEAFYALIEATDWDDIRDHTTKEIYQEISKLDMGTYQFEGTMSEIGSKYIERRNASRERRAALGI